MGLRGQQTWQTCGGKGKSNFKGGGKAVKGKWVWKSNAELGKGKSASGKQKKGAENVPQPPEPRPIPKRMPKSKLSASSNVAKADTGKMVGTEADVGTSSDGDVRAGEESGRDATPYVEQEGSATEAHDEVSLKDPPKDVDDESAMGTDEAIASSSSAKKPPQPKEIPSLMMLAQNRSMKAAAELYMAIVKTHQCNEKPAASD